MTNLTRRAFVHRSGLALGAAATLGLPSAVSAAAPVVDLSESRRRTYAALARLMQGRNGTPLTGVQAELRTSEFARNYADVAPVTREYVDQVLDGVEASELGGFSAAASLQQDRRLAGWRNAPTLADDAGASDLTRRRRSLADAAMELASSPSVLACEMKLSALAI